MSVEKAITGTLEERAIWETAVTELAKSGPRISSAPSEIAAEAAWRAPSPVPRVSFTRIWMLGEANSRSARSEAFFRFWASCPALPVAVSGRSRATRIGPVPRISPVGADAGPLADGEEPPKPPPVWLQADRPNTATMPRTAASRTGRSGRVKSRRSKKLLLTCGRSDILWANPNGTNHGQWTKP